MNHFIVAPLFYVFGSVITYFIMAIRFYRKQNYSYERYLRMMEDRDALSSERYHLKKENIILMKMWLNAVNGGDTTTDIIMDLAMNPDIAQRINQRVEGFFKQKREINSGSTK